MTCVQAPLAVLTEDDNQALISRGAHPTTVEPSFVTKLPTPILCIPKLSTSGWTDPGEQGASDLSLTFTLVDSTGSPQAGDPITIGSTTINTNSSGVAGPFVITNNYQPVVLTLTVTNKSGAPQAGLTVTLGGISKTTKSSRKVTFKISGTGVVS